ncbi:HEPN domain-containing protein [Sulfolobus tengchongensis]|uniref:HEPN domain-containing protein n=1 Tax=Sulfolobus tengchongensis TaxID=207809 RepID=A0AAX4KWE0_9CREN
MRDEARKWLEQAIEDLNTAKDIINAGHYYASAFWSQQAAEKALKAFLIEKGKIVRTHDLNEIVEIIKQELGVSVDEIFEDANKLTVHYTISRYPDAANGVPARIYTRSDAEELLVRAQRVIEWVKRNLQ